MPFEERVSKRLPLAETERSELLCWFCEHIEFSNGSPGYSDLTPGTEFSLRCGRGYWEFNDHDDGLDEFRGQLEAARRCADFSDRKES